MKLDIDCVRDVLLDLETFPIGCYTLYDFKDSLDKHGINNVLYTLSKLKEAGYINAEISCWESGSIDCYGVYNMTFTGHQFLETIRANKVWTKTQGILNQIGSHSFDLVKQVATAVLSQFLTTYL